MAVAKTENQPVESTEDSDLIDHQRRSDIPAAYYSDDEPPNPDDDDPHRQEFPYFESLLGYRLLILGIIAGLLFATVVHFFVILLL